MIDGLYKYEPAENPYDVGTLIVKATESETALSLKVVEKQMRFSSYVDLLFGDKDTVKISKSKSQHKINFGKDWFVIYPCRMGCPLSFVKVVADNG